MRDASETPGGGHEHADGCGVRFARRTDAMHEATSEANGHAHAGAQGSATVSHHEADDDAAACGSAAPDDDTCAELARFSVTVPENLLRAFDAHIARRGDAANRSEAIRDLIRTSLVKAGQRTPDERVIGSLTMIYDHHTGDLTRRLDEVQHDYTAEIVSTMHVHLDHHNCLEILALRGRGARVYELADKLLGLRGVKHGELTCAATGTSLEL